MKNTFHLDTIQECLFFSTGSFSAVLVKAKGRGWFIDSRPMEQPPLSNQTVKTILTDRFESSFNKCVVKKYKSKDLIASRGTRRSTTRQQPKG